MIGKLINRVVICALFASCAPSPQARQVDEPIAERTGHEHLALTASEQSDQEIHPWCRGSSLRAYLLTEDSLGPVTATIDRVQLQRTCPTARDTVVFDAEGRELEASVVVFGEHELGRVEWSQHGQLERLRVTSTLVHTRDGLRVGSTMRAVRQALSPLLAGYDDGGVYVWKSTQTSVSYIIDVPEIFDLLPSPDHVAERPDVIPDSAVVAAILFGPPS